MLERVCVEVVVAGREEDADINMKALMMSAAVKDAAESVRVWKAPGSSGGRGWRCLLQLHAVRSVLVVVREKKRCCWWMLTVELFVSSGAGTRDACLGPVSAALRS